MDTGSHGDTPDGGVCSPPVPSISLEELEAQITELAGHLNAANYRWLLLIAEFDRRKGWADGKLPSCAHWLNFKCGLNLGAAREKVRVGHALADLPKIAASMARGELSYSKVRALTREAQQHTQRSVHYWFAEDGSLVFKARLPAVAGALLIQALDAALEVIPQKEIRAQGVEERSISYASRRADALAVVAESFLAAPAAASATADRSTADRYQVVVHIDAETLHERGPGRCEIEHGPSIPSETARRLSCDASLVKVIENGKGEPLDVGRKTRSIPTAIRRALNTRDAGCRFPGCTHQRYVDAHHIEHWADGIWRFLRPDGSHFEVISVSPDLDYDGEEVQRSHTELGVHIDSNTAATRWRGERMDYELGAWVLCNQVDRARAIAQHYCDVAAETPEAARQRMVV